MEINKNVLNALHEFASDVPLSDINNITLSEISFSSAKHFEDFAEDEKQDLNRIMFAILSGLAVNMQILGITEDDICGLIIDKQ